MSFRKKPVQQQEGRRPSTGASSRIYSRANVSRYAERARQRRRGRMVRRGLVGGLLAVLLVGVVGAGAWVMNIAGKLKGPAITDALLATLVDSDVAKDPFYMLLLGTDGRKGEQVFRSDTIVLSRIDPTEKQVTLVSIPRDTRVQLADGSMGKINASYAQGGPEGVVKAVNDLCGIEISHYAEVNFAGMKDLVDAIGGVEVNVPDRIDDPKAGKGIVIEPGLQVLNGKEALAFCRSRAYGDGDYTRMRHQRIFIAALAKTVLEKTDPVSIFPLIESVADIVSTDLSIQDIASLANAMRGMDTDEIWSANVPSTTGMIDGVSYVIADEAQLAEMMERVDAGEDPEGPQTSDINSGQSSTIGDLTNNTATDYSNGTDVGVDGPKDDAEVTMTQGGSAEGDSYSEDEGY